MQGFPGPRLRRHSLYARRARAISSTLPTGLGCFGRIHLCQLCHSAVIPYIVMLVSKWEISVSSLLAVASTYLPIYLPACLPTYLPTVKALHGHCPLARWLCFRARHAFICELKCCVEPMVCFFAVWGQQGMASIRVAGHPMLYFLTGQCRIHGGIVAI